MTIVSHIALLNVPADAFDRINEASIGNQRLCSHTRNDQVEISNVVIITQIQLPAGYVCKNARSINEIVIGTRFKYPIVRDEAAFTNGECNVTLRAIKYKRPNTF